nr:MAG TPA: hypothetical protein [Caudoviricetes sp.]
MTELTKDRIEQFIKSPLEYGLTRSEQMEMALQLLAGLEQEPYGYVHKEVYESEGSCGLSSDHEAHLDSRTHIPLYAAPQLTQPAMVSDEMINTFEAEFRQAFKVSSGVEQLIEIDCQGEKFSLSIRDAATWWKLGRAIILKHSAPSIVTSDPCMMGMPKDADIDTIIPMLQGTSTPFVPVK